MPEKVCVVLLVADDALRPALLEMQLAQLVFFVCSLICRSLARSIAHVHAAHACTLTHARAPTHTPSDRLDISFARRKLA